MCSECFNFVLQVVTGKSYDAVLALASALHLMSLDGYDVGGVKLGFDFDEGPVKPWRNGAVLMNYIKKACKKICNRPGEILFKAS